MNRNALQFVVSVVFVLMMTLPSQAETHTTTVRGNSLEVQQTIKNIQSEIVAARAKLMREIGGQATF